ncbi:alpha-L-glutamate ligase [Streptomyces triculaminicus]|uniref:alpha-L-glutamate ligase n=1 Tax=Streptomyces triculaminicus TaxID=2816232 RepID=UPI0033EEBFB9
MILFYGCAHDSPFAAAVDAARTARIDHRVIDQTRLGRHDLVVHADGGGWLAVDGTRLPLEEITAVYLRPLTPRPEAGSTEAARARAAALNTNFLQWLDVAPALVVNRPGAMAPNGSKPYQAQLIARAGFLVPETLVTNDPDEVGAFRDLHGRVVYKSVSAMRSIVQEFTEADEARLRLVRHLPTQFQAYVPGRDVRVHVVGERTFAAQVDSDAIDYRYASRGGRRAVLAPMDPPDDIARGCVMLAASLDLPFAGVDLRVRPDGAWVCFEVNPMPAYLYYEAEAGLPISAALVGLLAGADVRASLP